MKVVLSICLLVLLPFSMAAEDCLKLHNLTSLQVEAVAPNTPVSDLPSNIKCYSRCVIHGYIGSDGKIDLQLVENRSNPQEQQILGECKQSFDDNTDLDKCDYAYLMLQCLYLGKTRGAHAS